VLPAGSGGVELDGWGGWHGFSLGAGPVPAAPSDAPYWPGWDIARDVAFLTQTSGYVLDGWGGIHPFGGAPAVGGAGYWPGWDIARDVALLPNGQGGFVLDGWGGLHPFGIGAAPPPSPTSSTPHWPGWSIARGLAIVGAADTPGTGGYLVDGFGGLHRFALNGNPIPPPPTTPTPYWPGWAIARDVTVLPDGSGGWVLDGYGGLHAFGLNGTAPTLNRTPIVSGLTNPWDLGFTPDATMLFTERPGPIKARLPNGTINLLTTPPDVVVASEAGMMGLAIDPQFASNRFVYTCFASTLGGVNNDVRVARWTINANYTGVSNRLDIVTGAPVNISGQLGRHSGCRPRFGPDGYLWIGTGDAATGTTPQNHFSLGGKVLRVDRNGAGAPGNAGAGFDPRVFNYGHRNVQGLAFRPGDGMPFSVEHGPAIDDEVNVLVSGGNYGWDPVPGYNESVPMTDFVKFPGAIAAVWSSGNPTIAPSGGGFVSGPQ
jgi:aldose sugar dehydrogenase